MTEFEGVVLAGGASRRMGQDKALLHVVGSDGRDLRLVERPVQALRDAGATRVRVFGGDAEALRSLGLEVVPDEAPGEGPLPAIAHALRSAREQVVVVLACDFPHVTAPAVRALVDALDGGTREAGVVQMDGPLLPAVAGESRPGRPADLAVAAGDGGPNWLAAAWRRECHGVLDLAVARGERAIHRAVEPLRAREASTPVPGAFDDVDDPAALSGIEDPRARGGPR